MPEPARSGKDMLRDWLVGLFSLTVALWLAAALFQSARLADAGVVLTVATVCVLFAYLAVDRRPTL